MANEKAKKKFCKTSKLFKGNNSSETWEREKKAVFFLESCVYIFFSLKNPNIFCYTSIVPVELGCGVFAWVFKKIFCRGLERVDCIIYWVWFHVSASLDVRHGLYKKEIGVVLLSLCFFWKTT